MNNNSNRDYATENINLKQQIMDLKKEIASYMSEERLVENYGKEILEMFGEYEPVAINNVSWEEEEND